MQNNPIHASCVAVDDRGLLVLGPAGSGKSSLALQLMAYGADLVADDRVALRAEGAALMAEGAPNIANAIEARGIGILRASTIGPVPLVAAVDLGQRETQRLPEMRHFTALGCEIPLLCFVEGPHFAPALLQILKFGLRGDL